MEFNTFKASDNYFIPSTPIDMNLIIKLYIKFVYLKSNTKWFMDFNTYTASDKCYAPISPI